MIRFPLEFRAVAFDLDGILIDTEPIFAESVRRFLEPRQIAFDPAFMPTMMGTPAVQVLPKFREYFGLRESVEEIARECKEHFLAALGNRAGPLMPGVTQLLDELGRRRVPFGIATSSSREFVQRVFAPHGLLDRFQFVLTCEDVSRGKPFPDVYELAASRFGISPQQMLVFEDSPNGVRAAKSAGAPCIVVPHSHTPRHLIEGADLIVPSLHSDELYRALGWTLP